MPALDSYRHAHAHFGQILATVDADGWERQTPCSDWTVQDLAGHVIGGEHMSVALLGGATSDEAIEQLRGRGLDADPIAAYATAVAASEAAFSEPGALERTVHHPIGDVPGTQLLDFRIGDLTLHSWDLSRAIGGDEALPQPLVETVWGQLEPLSSVISTIGLFGDGPSGSVGEDAELQLRLLDLTGRRP